MRNKLIVIGASGHGAVVSEIAQLIGFSPIYLDDDTSKHGKDIDGVYCMGGVSLLNKLSPKEYQVAIGVGNNTARQKIFDLVKAKTFKLPNLIHPSASISHSVTFGAGIVVSANAIINPFANIADGSIINSGAIVEHHCGIGMFSHISPGAVLAGAVTVGERVWVGANATIIQGCSIVSDSIIGAGSVVISSINSQGTYVGAPVIKIK